MMKSYYIILFTLFVSSLSFGQIENITDGDFELSTTGALNATCGAIPDFLWRTCSNTTIEDDVETSGNQAAYLVYNTTVGLRKKISVTSGIIYTVSFNARTYGSPLVGGKKVSIYFLANSGDPLDTTTKLTGLSGNSDVNGAGDQWVKKIEATTFAAGVETFTFTPTVTGEVVLVIRRAGQNNTPTINDGTYFDNISITHPDACSSPDDVTDLSTIQGDSQINLNWTNGTCADEILVVGKAGSAVTVAPTGDGTAYTPDAVFGSGTDLGTGEYAVYKGTGTTETITALTNATDYHFKVFTRFGTDWSTGVTANATPVMPTILISEVMASPSGGDKGREYFEVYNYGATPIDLNGWSFEQDGASHTISTSVSVPADSFIVLGIEDSSVDTPSTSPNLDGVTLDYVYPDTTGLLFNGHDYIVLKNGSGLEIDRVEWGTFNLGVDPIPSAKSSKAIVFIGTDADDNNIGSNWTLAVVSYDSDINFGSPGLSNEEGFKVLKSDGNWVPSAPTGGEDVFIFDAYTVSSDLTLGYVYVSPIGSLDVTGGVFTVAEMTIAAGAVLTNNGTITNSGVVTFKSNVTGSAYLGAGTGTISGNVSIERYIPARRAYRLLSTPVTTTNFIANNWQQGTHITGAVGIVDPTPDPTTGFDFTASGNPSMFTFSNGSYEWSEISNTNAVNLVAGTPYRIMVRGDRAIDLTNNADLATPTTLVSTGTLAKEGTDSTVNLEFNDDSNTETDYNFVGNPFQAPVNMNTILAAGTNVNATYYWIWDPNVNTRGGYVSIDVTDDSTILEDPGTAPTTTAANRYLQAGQAAFVQTTSATTPAITFTQVSKNTADPETDTFKGLNTKSSSSKLRLSLYESSALAESRSVADGLLIRFDDNYSNEVNYSDASKFTNLDENFATSNNGKLLSIEKRATPTVSDEIPLSITAYRSTNYTIVAQGTSMSGETAFLFDAYTNEYTEIPQNGSVDYAYSIDVNIPDSISPDRFSITFSSQALSVGDLEIHKMHLYPNPVSTGIFNLHVPQEMDDLELTVYNVLGAKLYSQSGFRAGSKATIETTFAKEKGLYFVKLSSKGNSTTKKLIIN